MNYWDFKGFICQTVRVTPSALFFFVNLTLEIERKIRLENNTSNLDSVQKKIHSNLKH